MTERLTSRDILRFYLPLMATSQMMTLSGPVINIAVGRAPDPTLDFAAYWIGFSIILFLEAPCLSMQQVTAALIAGHASFRKLMICALTIGTSATIGALAIALTPLRDFVFLDIIATTPRVAERAAVVLAILAPIPILIALRGVGNGIGIRMKRTILVARATLFRILSLSTAIGIVVVLKTGSGAIAGAFALLTGLTIEMIVIWIGVYPFVRDRFPLLKNRRDITYREIIRVSYPLAISAYVWTSTRPVINAILGRLPDPELAQAGFGLIAPVVLMTCSPLWALHNVSLILPESGSDMRKIIRFSFIITLVYIGIILVLINPPVRHLLLRNAFALSPRMEALVAPAMLLILIEPILLSVRSVCQGLIMRARATEIFGIASGIKLLMIIGAGLFVVNRHPGVNGAVLGTALFVCADFVDAVLFLWKSRVLALRGVLFPSLHEEPQEEGAA